MSDVIDAHHHLIDPGRHRYPWLTDSLAAIDRRFGVEDLAPELAAAGVDRTIMVQTISSTTETLEFLDVGLFGRLVDRNRDFAHQVECALHGLVLRR